MFVIQDPENYIFPNFGKVSFEDGTIPEYITGLNVPFSADAEISFECDINVPVFAKLCGIDLAAGQDVTCASVIFQKPYQMQVRHHKKKRINKKWAKRYGFVTKFKTYRIEEANIRQNGERIDICGRDLKWLV